MEMIRHESRRIAFQISREIFERIFNNVVHVSQIARRKQCPSHPRQHLFYILFLTIISQMQRGGEEIISPVVERFLFGKIHQIEFRNSGAAAAAIRSHRKLRSFVLIGNKKIFATGFPFQRNWRIMLQFLYSTRDRVHFFRED